MFFLEKDADGEEGDSCEQPLDAPDLDGLPIEKGGGGEDKAGDGCGYYAGASQNQRDQRSNVQFKQPGQEGKCRPQMQAALFLGYDVAAVTADITEVGADQEIGSAISAYWANPIMLCAFRRGNCGGPPEFFALFKMRADISHKPGNLIDNTKMLVQDKGTQRAIKVDSPK